MGLGLAERVFDSKRLDLAKWFGHADKAERAGGALPAIHLKSRQTWTTAPTMPRVPPTALGLPTDQRR
jgi:hypothetical protein